MSRSFIPNYIKTISHPIRQNILGELKSGKKTIKELQRISKDNVYTLYHHINILEKNEIIASENLNNEKHYSINVNNPYFSQYGSIIEIMNELQKGAEFELIKIGIPHDTKLISAIENKLQEINSLVGSAKGVTENYLIFLKRKQDLDKGGKIMIRNPEDIVEEYVRNQDLEGLDVLSTLAYQQSGITSYRTNESSFIREIKKCAERNLFLKYSLSKEDCKSKIDILDNIIKEHKYDGIGNFRSLLIQHTSGLMKQNFKEIYIKLNEIDKMAIKYILDYFPFKIKESRDSAIKKESIGFEYIDGFSIHTEPRDATDENNIIYFEITGLLKNLEEKNQIYSILNGGEFNINKNSLDRNIEYLPSCPTLGNLLVKAGLGYWTPWVTTNVKGNVYYRLIVPKYLYDIATEFIKSPKPPEERMHGGVLEHKHPDYDFWHPASREHN